MSAEDNIEMTLYDTSAGDLSLAFLNTLNWRGRAEPEELLLTYADLVTWIREAGLIDASQAEALADRAGADPDQAQKALAEMIRHREGLYRVFTALIRGLAPPAEDLRFFNQALGAAVSHRQIQFEEAGPRWAWQEGAFPLLDPLRPILLAAAHLMVSEERSQIHTCGNAECLAMFVDRSRNQSRKWCSSESCGNRIRVRQFYSRSRKPEGPSHSDHS
jgi:predicted RNA-binding Zn ribbon-like protein